MSAARFQGLVLPLLTALLVACPYVGEEKYGEIRDFDGDNLIAERFGGKDCDDHDKNIGDCDVDGDGFRSIEVGGTDCDDRDGNVHPDATERCNDIDDDCDSLIDDDDDSLADAPLWFEDFDGDGFGNPDGTKGACAQPANHVPDDSDCDDSRDDVHPGATEFCDALDRNCDGDPVDNAVDPVEVFVDSDGDGFGAGASVNLACEAGPGQSLTNDDCNDGEALAFPGAVEVWYDGIDSDCDGASDYDQDGDGHEILGYGGDCNDEDPTVLPGALEICDGGVDNNCNGVADSEDGTVDPVGLWTYYLDADQDGAGDPASQTGFCPNTEPDGWIIVGGDCNDSLDNVLPGGTEICDNQDNDCDGVIDDGAVGMVDFFVDGDGDGYGGDVTQAACSAGPGLVNVTGDCNDGDPFTYPGAPEICGDAFRQDCTTLPVDDCDSDGFADVASGGTDCDDSDPEVNPNATEICDGLDNDCDGLFDDDDYPVDTTNLPDWYRDADLDGFGDPFDVVAFQQCSPPGGASIVAGDCDDSDPNTYPGALELCDGLDNDCDCDPVTDPYCVPEIDEHPLAAPNIFYLDNDGDGFGNPSLQYAQDCNPPGPEWIEDNTDCHDGYADMNPLAQEVCDGLDNDCDGDVDDADPSATLNQWYLDGDGDGYGQDGVVELRCDQPVGYAPLNGDCNDTDASQNPGASEVCDGGIDNDCDGLGDDADPDLASAVTWFLDSDSDGFGDPLQSQVQCSQPAGWVSNAGDCDDGQASVSPAAIELCDGTDNDCDTLVDDADPGVVGAPFWYADTDGDAWGDNTNTVNACSQPPGMLPQAGDCNDNDDAIHPGAPEICDGIDNDCDLAIDDADLGVIPTTWYQDADLDGAGDPSVSQASCAFPGAGWTTDSSDCDDGNNSVNPLAVEVCNFIDDNCDGQVDDDDPMVTAQPTWYADGDGDGWGDDTQTIVSCEGPIGYASSGGDCDDANSLANPGVTIERCNGFDDDCDTLVDDQDPNAIGTMRYWPDADGDLSGDSSSAGVLACNQPVGWSANNLDCNDSVPAIGPNATEVCNGLDDDCDTLTDEADPSLANGLTWYADLDGDSFGNPGLSTLSCAAVPGYVTNGSDCDDFEPNANPLAAEVCDGIDNDCDGATDDADGGILFRPTWYDDVDGDGYGDDLTGVPQCEAPLGWVDVGGDCDDSDAGRNPGAPEVCDGVDNDCDVAVDDQDSDLIGGGVFYTDADGDGFGDPAGVQTLCAAGPGTSADGTDCNDGDAALYPGQVLFVSPSGGAWATVQAAIDAACTDGEVRITGGVWSEQLNLGGKRLVVGGLDPDARPRFIGAPSPVITASGGEPAGTAIENLRIAATTGTSGVGATLLDSNVVFRNVEFDGLVATNNGGAVQATNAVVEFDDCTFAGGSAVQGGAVHATDSDVTIVDSLFDGMSADTEGSSVYAFNSNLVMAGVAVLNQTGGAAIYSRSDQVAYAILSGVLLRNTDRPARFEEVDVYLESVDSRGALGRLYVAGTTSSVSLDAIGLRVGGVTGSEHGIELYGPLLDASLSNVEAYANNAGGMLAQSVANLSLQNSSFVGNGTTGLNFAAGSADLRNVLVYGNVAGTQLTYSGAWFTASTVDYSLFENPAESGAFGGANLAADPDFLTYHPSLSGDHWDLHPRLTSLALSAGDPSIANSDGSTPSHIGSVGGPYGDAAWYADADTDGLLDGWEIQWFGDTLQRNGSENDDSDGWDAFAELSAGTSPVDSDTDGDGAADDVDTEPLNPGVL